MWFPHGQQKNMCVLPEGSVLCKKSFQKALFETKLFRTSRSNLDNSNTPCKTRKNKKREAQYIKGTNQRSTVYEGTSWDHVTAGLIDMDTILSSRFGKCEGLASIHLAPVVQRAGNLAIHS